MAYTEKDRKNHITELQNYLKCISENGCGIPSVFPSGIYGKDTAEAVKKFQEAYGLPVTGKTDKETWDKIFSEYNSAMEKLSESMPLSVFKDTLREGAKGSKVSILQAMLNALSERYSNFEALAADGIFGSRTADAVKQLQKIIGETPSGNVDLPTWNRLAALYDFLSAESQ